MPQRPSTLGSDLQRQRFWAKVEKSPDADGCWVWTGALWGGGYGVVRVEKAMWAAHRLSWHLEHGEIPADMQVLHRCDNRPCVRPDHLFLGTQADNMRDMALKLRNDVQRTPEHLDKMRAARRNFVCGERHGRARLDAVRVHRIRALRAEGWTQQRIAETVGVDQTTVSRVLIGKSWTSVT